MEELLKNDELVRELFDELSPLFMQPYHMESSSNSSLFSPDSHIPSPPYSGPTVDEIETAPPFGTHGLGHGDSYMSEAERSVHGFIFHCFNYQDFWCYISLF